MKKASRIILALVIIPLLIPLVQAGTNFVGGGVNVQQVGGVTTATGAGASNTGTQRVILASDSPAGNVTNAGTFAVQVTGVSASTIAVTNVNGQSLNVSATLAAETTKVIGTVNLSAAQTLATVTAVTAITNALPAGTNNIGTVSGSTVSVSGMPKCGGVPVQTRVGCTTSSGQLVAGNATRCGIEIDSDASPDNTDKVFLNYGSVAATNAMKRLEVGSSYQPPVISTVAIQCLAKTGTQNVIVIEYNY